MDLTGEYEVASGGAPVGRLTVRRTGPRTEFDFHSDTLLDVSRLVALGDGTAASIGIPVPKDGGLALTRSFSDAALAAMGLTSIRRAVLIPADADVAAFAREESPAANAPEPQKSNTPDPAAAQSPQEIVPEKPPEPEPANNFPKEANSNTEEKRVSEPAPAQSFPEALRVPDGNGTALAFPWSPQEPFPLTPFFREGRPAEIEGRTYIVYPGEAVPPEPSQTDKKP